MGKKYSKYYIRQAKTFNVCIFDMQIPKNAIYGRKLDTYYYVKNFEQFKEQRDKYEVYLFTLRDNYFHKVQMVSTNTIVQKVMEFVQINNLYDIKCQEHFGVNLERLYKMECRGNNAVNSYKSVSKSYYTQGWFKR